MDRIEKYIKSLSKRVQLPPQEMADFRSEIRNHLLDTVKELQQQGVSEKESVAIALNRFGAEKFINTELRRVIRFQNTFRKSMLWFAFVFLAASVVFLTLYLWMDHRNRTSFDGMQTQFHEQLAKRALAGDAITEEEVASFYRDNKRILRFVAVLPASGQAQTTEIVSPRNTDEAQLNEQPYFVYSLVSEEGKALADVKIALNREVLFSDTPNLLLMIASVCFAVYWMLYGVWNTLNAYRMNRLNAGWVILFFTLNAVAYVLFAAAGRIETRRVRLVI